MAEYVRRQPLVALFLRAFAALGVDVLLRRVRELPEAVLDAPAAEEKRPLAKPDFLLNKGGSRPQEVSTPAFKLEKEVAPAEKPEVAPHIAEAPIAPQEPRAEESNSASLATAPTGPAIWTPRTSFEKGNFEVPTFLRNNSEKKE